MAFMDKLGQIANKVGDVAGDTLDYGKAKGKIVLERGKLKDAKESLGTYVYDTVKGGGTLDMNIIASMCGEVDVHMKEIARLEAEAKASGEIIADALEGKGGNE